MIETQPANVTAVIALLETFNQAAENAERQFYAELEMELKASSPSTKSISTLFASMAALQIARIKVAQIIESLESVQDLDRPISPKDYATQFLIAVIDSIEYFSENDSFLNDMTNHAKQKTPLFDIEEVKQSWPNVIQYLRDNISVISGP